MSEDERAVSDTLYGYYAQERFLPTHGSFSTPADLEAYDREREALFVEKLSLPPRVFRGARLLEFGPDAGENSLVFARWGADCTLVEPHLGAHDVIRGYFDRFGLNDRLVALLDHDFLGYPVPAAESERFDIVDAEGFIFTIRPPSAWIRKLQELLRPGGFAVAFYMESFGMLLELVWKIVHSRLRSLTGLDAVECGRAAFETKWSSIPHKRRLEAWVMDNLENPFVRLEYCIDAKELCRQATDAGLRLYSSWPRYEGGLDVYWHKRVLAPADALDRQLDFISRNRLGYVFGGRHVLVEPDPAADEELLELLSDVDALIDAFDSERAARCDERLGGVAQILRSRPAISTAEATEHALETVAMLRKLLEALDRGSADEILAFCNGDEAFINSWGMPVHFVVLRKSESSAGTS